MNEREAEKNIEVTAKEEVLLDNALILETSVIATPPLVTVKESERSQKGDQKTPHEEESEEEVSEREAEINGEAQITSHEFTAEEEVLLPDSITPSIKLFLFNIILPTIDIFLDTTATLVLAPLSPSASSATSCSQASPGGDSSLSTRRNGVGYSLHSSSGRS